MVLIWVTRVNGKLDFFFYLESTRWAFSYGPYSLRQCAVCTSSFDRFYFDSMRFFASRAHTPSQTCLNDSQRNETGFLFIRFSCAPIRVSLFSIHSSVFCYMNSQSRVYIDQFVSFVTLANTHKLEYGFYSQSEATLPEGTSISSILACEDEKKLNAKNFLLTERLNEVNMSKGTTSISLPICSDVAFFDDFTSQSRNLPTFSIRRNQL